MKNIPKILFPLTIAIALSISSCIKPKEFSTTPEIVFKDFIELRDSALFMFSFTDGDGDIGLDSNYTYPPFNPPLTYEYPDTNKDVPAGEFYYNFYLDYWEKQNGIFVKLNLNPPFYYRIPVITPIGQNKTLEGEISIKMNPPYFAPTSDTVKFTAFLYDRAKHKSNIIETPQFIVKRIE